MRCTRERRIAAALALAGLVGPVPSLAALDATNSATSSTARFTSSGFVPAVVEMLGDRVNVSVSSIASEGYDPGPLYGGDFSYQARMFGSATGLYGGGFGTLSGIAEAQPAEVPSLEGGSPLANLDQSAVDGTIQVGFIETGVVTGPAPGTPVTLEVNLLLETGSAVGGGIPSFPREASAQFFGRVIDNDNGFVGVERRLFADGLEMLELDTFVGHELSLEGRLGLFVRGRVGSARPFVPNLDAAVTGVGTVYLGVPEGFGVQAVSGHDYTVPVPEPADLPLALFGAAALASMRRARGCARGRPG